MSEASVQVREHGPGCSCVRCSGFELANRHAVRHGAHVAILLPAELDEVAVIVAELRALAPDAYDSDLPTIEAMALCVWRLRRMYRDLDAHGLVREGGKPAPLLKHVAIAERQLQSWCDRLGLHVQARSTLGLKDAQRQALRPRSYDLGRLDPGRRARAQELYQELEAIVADAEVVDVDA